MEEGCISEAQLYACGFPNCIYFTAFLWKMVSFLFMQAKVKKIIGYEMLTLLDEIFIVVIGVGTLEEKTIYCQYSV